MNEGKRGRVSVGRASPGVTPPRRLSVETKIILPALISQTRRVIAPRYYIVPFASHSLHTRVKAAKRIPSGAYKECAGRNVRAQFS